MLIFGSMHYSGGMFGNISMFWTQHNSGGMCKQKCKFLDPCITMEKCEFFINALHLGIFMTHELNLRNVQLKLQICKPKHQSGGMCTQYINFLDPCITAEEFVANTLIFGLMHYSGGMCRQNLEFLDLFITAEDCIGPKHYGGGLQANI